MDLYAFILWALDLLINVDLCERCWIYADLYKFMRRGATFMRIYMDLCERLDNLQLHTAQERYAILMNTRPELLQRVPLKHLASFLSVTPETLSRIRGK